MLNDKLIEDNNPAIISNNDTITKKINFSNNEFGTDAIIDDDFAPSRSKATANGNFTKQIKEEELNNSKEERSNSVEIEQATFKKVDFSNQLGIAAEDNDSFVPSRSKAIDKPKFGSTEEMRINEGSNIQTIIPFTCPDASDFKDKIQENNKNDEQTKFIEYNQVKEDEDSSKDNQIHKRKSEKELTLKNIQSSNENFSSPEKNKSKSSFLNKNFVLEERTKTEISRNNKDDKNKGKSENENLERDKDKKEISFEDNMAEKNSRKQTSRNSLGIELSTIEKGDENLFMTSEQPIKELTKTETIKIIDDRGKAVFVPLSEISASLQKHITKTGKEKVINMKKMNSYSKKLIKTLIKDKDIKPIFIDDDGNVLTLSLIYDSELALTIQKYLEDNNLAHFTTSDLNNFKLSTKDRLQLKDKIEESKERKLSAIMEKLETEIFEDGKSFVIVKMKGNQECRIQKGKLSAGILEKIKKNGRIRADGKYEIDFSKDGQKFNLLKDELFNNLSDDIVVLKNGPNGKPLKSRYLPIDVLRNLFNYRDTTSQVDFEMLPEDLKGEILKALYQKENPEELNLKGTFEIKLDSQSFLLDKFSLPQEIQTILYHFAEENCLNIDKLYKKSNQMSDEEFKKFTSLISYIQSDKSLLTSDRENKRENLFSATESIIMEESNENESERDLRLSGKVSQSKKRSTEKLGQKLRESIQSKEFKEDAFNLRESTQTFNPKSNIKEKETTQKSFQNLSDDDNLKSHRSNNNSEEKSPFELENVNDANETHKKSESLRTNSITPTGGHRISLFKRASIIDENIHESSKNLISTIKIVEKTNKSPKGSLKEGHRKNKLIEKRNNDDNSSEGVAQSPISNMSVLEKRKIYATTMKQKTSLRQSQSKVSLMPKSMTLNRLS